MDILIFLLVLFVFVIAGCITITFVINTLKPGLKRLFIVIAVLFVTIISIVVFMEHIDFGYTFVI